MIIALVPFCAFPIDSLQGLIHSVQLHPLAAAHARKPHTVEQNYQPNTNVLTCAYMRLAKPLRATKQSVHNLIQGSNRLERSIVRHIRFCIPEHHQVPFALI